MKIKKFLEKAAEEDRESLINDRDIEFLASIGVDYNKKREAAKKEPDSSYYLTAGALNNKALLAGIACFLVVAITAVALSLYFSLRSPSVVPPAHYFEDNFVEVDSNLQELNDDLELFTLTVDIGEYDVSIRKTYDSLSGDDIFFTLEFTSNQGLSKKFRFDLVVNKFYSYNELIYSGEIKETQFSGYTIKYTERVNTVFDATLITVECKGEMQIGDQWIYITKYNETYIEQSTFIETIQSLISFK